MVRAMLVLSRSRNDAYSGAPVATRTLPMRYHWVRQPLASMAVTMLLTVTGIRAAHAADSRQSVPPQGFAAVRGDRASGYFGQTRSEVVARNGVVAASQPLAAQAGLQILKSGGNAFDAAVATAAVLNLVGPESTGMGGDVFVIAWLAKEKKLVALHG